MTSLLKKLGCQWLLDYYDNNQNEPLKKCLILSVAFAIPCWILAIILFGFGAKQQKQVDHTKESTSNSCPAPPSTPPNSGKTVYVYKSRPLPPTPAPSPSQPCPGPVSALVASVSVLGSLPELPLPYKPAPGMEISTAHWVSLIVPITRSGVSTGKAHVISPENKDLVGILEKQANLYKYAPSNCGEDQICNEFRAFKVRVKATQDTKASVVWQSLEPFLKSDCSRPDTVNVTATVTVGPNGKPKEDTISIRVADKSVDGDHIDACLKDAVKDLINNSKFTAAQCEDGPCNEEGKIDLERVTMSWTWQPKQFH